MDYAIADQNWGGEGGDGFCDRNGRFRVLCLLGQVIGFRPFIVSLVSVPCPTRVGSVFKPRSEFVLDMAQTVSDTCRARIHV